MLNYFLIFSKAFSLSLIVPEFADSIYTSSLFDITLSLSDSVQSVNEHNITAFLYTSETESKSLFVGKNSCLTDLEGSCLLEGLQIQIPGTYYFMFRVSEIDFFSEEFQVFQGFSSIIVNTSNSVFSAYSSVTLLVFVIGVDGKLWVDDWVEYTIKSTGLFFGQNSGIYGFCIDGYDSIGTFIDIAGLYNISVTSGYIESEKIQLEVKENKLKFMEVSLTEMFVETEFNVKVGIFDQELKNLAEFDQYTYVTLLIKSGELTLNNSVQVKDGIAVFENIQISKAGDYQIEAESVGRAKTTFESFLLVKNYPLGLIILNIPENITAYFDFSVDFELINTNGTAFNDPCAVNLSSSASLSGNTQVVTKNGKGTFYLYSREPGDITLFLYSNLSISNYSEISVKSPIIELTTEAFLSNTSNYFNIYISVLDYYKSEKKLTENLGVIISLTPNGILYGQNELETMNGFVEFKNLTILTIGEFNFKATLKSFESSNALTIVSSEQKFNIGEYQTHLPKELQSLTRVLTFIEDSEVNAYFGFVIKILLLDQIQENFKQDCEVGVIGNNSVYGEAFKGISSGESSLEVYTKNSGGIKLLITACESLSNTTEFIVLPLSGSIEVDEVIENGYKEFEITVKIMDFYGNKIESKNGLYNIELTTTPLSNISGQFSASQVKGEYIFSNLTIFPAGNYTFNANITESMSSTQIYVASGVFTVPKTEQDRNSNPLIIFISLFWLMVIFCVVFYINDRNFMISDNEKNSIYKYLSLLSFNNPGINHFRIVSVLRIFSDSYIIFTLLGLFYCKNTMNQILNENFSVQIIWDSISVLFFAQGVNLPLTLVHFFNLNNKSACKIVSAICLLIIFTCFGFDLWLIIKCNQQFSSTWVLNFAVFTGIDLIIFQPIYGYCFYKFKKSPEPSHLALIKKQKNIPLLNPPFPIRSPRQTPIRTAVTPSFLKSPNLDFENIKRSTVTPSVRKFFVFDEKSVPSSYKNQSSVSTELPLPKSPKITFPKKK